MSAAENQAVFLSYASQDAEAVARIAGALRASGVEVWFDRDELVGGDAWDAKIRRQIAECALFVPVISVSTQARLEGYFRIEWKLAARRTHAMATAKAFLLPVVIDDTRDAEAHVPDEFREVQWTRLPGGETPEKFCARVQRLLSENGRDVSPRRPLSDSTTGPGRLGELTPPAGSKRPWLVPAITGLLAVVALVVWQRVHKTESSGSVNSMAVAPSSPQLKAQQLVAQARELYSKMDYTRADLAAADEFARKATDIEPALADGWGARAMVQAGYVVRGFVSGDERTRQSKEVQVLANRALVLQPDNPDALVALAKVLDGSVTESFLRRAVAAHPDHERALLALGEDLRNKWRLEEAQAIFDEAVRRHPNSIGAYYDLSGNYMRMGNLPKAWEAIERALAIRPFMRGLLIKAYLAGVGRGDLPLMRATLDSLAPTDRTEDRAVYLAIWAALLEHEPKRALEAAAQTPRDYLVDATGFFTGPKAMLVATAHRLAGSPNLARQQWQSAEVLLRQRRQQDPGNLEDVVMLATVLVWLGQETEAQSVVAPAEQAWREQLTQRRAQSLAEYYAARSDGPRAAEYLRAALVGLSPSRLTRHALRLDPRWDRLRGQPSFEAVEREAAAIEGKVPRVSEPPATAAEKSLAVLAFRNLSDEQTGDYFSDGLSDELCSVLGRVPGLRVTGSTSAFSFKGKSVTLPDIARQLGVAYLIEGSVKREGSDVHITAKLINGTDGLQVWTSGNLKRKVESSLALQEEIAALIAKELSLKLGVASAASTATVNPRAFELYLQGRQAWNLRTPAGFERAEALFKQTLEIEPALARAHAALADVWLVRGQQLGAVGQFGQRASAEQARIVAKAREALSLDPDSAEAHASLGGALWNEWNLPEAERALRRAIVLNPSYATAHQWLGRILENKGQANEALAELKLAAELDPLSSVILFNYGLTLCNCGRYTEAIPLLDRALTLQPNSAQAIFWKAKALLSLGHNAAAVALVRQLPADDASTRAIRIGVLVPAGLKAEAEALLTPSDHASRNPWVLLVLGRRDEAITTLDESLTGANQVGTLLFTPDFDSIRDHPRFREFLATLGLTEAHARAQAWRAAHPPEKPAAK